MRPLPDPPHAAARWRLVVRTRPLPTARRPAAGPRADRGRGRGGTSPGQAPAPVRHSSPARPRIDLEAQLRKLGLDVEMWPGFDAYDLQVTFRRTHLGGRRQGLETSRPARPRSQSRTSRAAIQRGMFGRPGRTGRCAPRLPRHLLPEPHFPQAEGLPLLTDRQLIALAKDRLRGDTSVRLTTPRSANGAAHA